MPESRVALRPHAPASTRLAACGLAVAAASPLLADPLAEPFPAALSLADLDGAIGFRLAGAAAGDLAGHAVASAGDVNGDGVDDLVVGAYLADPGGRDRAGQTYVIFGRDPASGGFPAVIELASVDGAIGFRLVGIDPVDFSGNAVAPAGDVNGDGVGDLIVGANLADPGGRDRAGEAYVVFGRDGGGFPAALELSSLDGVNGFRLEGVDVLDRSGGSVASAGDVNGDGVDDIIVGASGADPDGRTRAGASYVVFGRDGGVFPAAIELSSLDGVTGFRLDGADAGDESGEAVASAGDVNGDGVDDLIIGAPDAAPGGRENAGASYVVFGNRAGFPAAIGLASLDGVNGFRLDGVNAFDRSGIAVASAGDVNGDGVDDLIIGARDADPGGRVLAGASYVVFGSRGGFPATVQLADLDGVRGFRLDGVDAVDQSGWSVAPAGDANGDGVDDIIVGASSGDPGGRENAGEAYVVFGRDGGGFPAAIALSSLDGATGLRLDGVGAGDSAGRSVARAGDVNGDGVDDVIVGARAADPGGRVDAGEAYVVFGRDPGRACPADLDGDGELTIFDFLAFQNAFDAGCP